MSSEVDRIEAAIREAMQTDEESARRHAAYLLAHHDPASQLHPYIVAMFLDPVLRAAAIRVFVPTRERLRCDACEGTGAADWRVVASADDRTRCSICEGRGWIWSASPAPAVRPAGPPPGWIDLGDGRCYMTIQDCAITYEKAWATVRRRQEEPWMFSTPEQIEQLRKALAREWERGAYWRERYAKETGDEEASDPHPRPPELDSKDGT